MESFLQRTKQQLQGGEFQRIHIVLGNEASDLDSVVSSIVHAFFLDKVRIPDESCLYLPVLNIPRQDYRLRTEVTYLLDRNGIEESLLVFSDEIDLSNIASHYTLSLTLVDHNVLSAQQFWLESYVTEVIDHHRQDDWEWADDCQVTIEPVGSCATLIAGNILQQRPELVTEKIAELLMGTILLDTVNLSAEAGRVTERDLEVVHNLQENYSFESPDELFNSLQMAKFSQNGLSVQEIVRKDYKCTQVGEYKIGISSIMSDLQNDLLQKEDVESKLSGFVRGNNLDALVLMGITIQSDSEGRERQLAIFTPSKGDPCRQQLADHLTRTTEPTLGLEPLESGYENITLFHQQNTAASRKIVLPIITEAAKSFPDKEGEASEEELAGTPSSPLDSGMGSSDNPISPSAPGENLVNFDPMEGFSSTPANPPKDLFGLDPFDPLSHENDRAEESSLGVFTSSASASVQQSTSSTDGNTNLLVDVFSTPSIAINPTSLPEGHTSSSLLTPQSYDPFLTSPNDTSVGEILIAPPNSFVDPPVLPALFSEKEISEKLNEYEKQPSGVSSEAGEVEKHGEGISAWEIHKATKVPKTPPNSFIDSSPITMYKSHELIPEEVNKKLNVYEFESSAISEGETEEFGESLIAYKTEEPTIKEEKAEDDYQLQFTSDESEPVTSSEKNKDENESRAQEDYEIDDPGTDLIQVENSSASSSPGNEEEEEEDQVEAPHMPKTPPNSFIDPSPISMQTTLFSEEINEKLSAFQEVQETSSEDLVAGVAILEDSSQQLLENPEQSKNSLKSSSLSESDIFDDDSSTTSGSFTFDPSSIAKAGNYAIDDIAEKTESDNLSDSSMPISQEDEPSESSINENIIPPNQTPENVLEEDSAIDTEENKVDLSYGILPSEPCRLGMPPSSHEEDVQGDDEDSEIDNKENKVDLSYGILPSEPCRLGMPPSCDEDVLSGDDAEMYDDSNGEETEEQVTGIYQMVKDEDLPPVDKDSQQEDDSKETTDKEENIKPLTEEFQLAEGKDQPSVGMEDLQEDNPEETVPIDEEASEQVMELATRSGSESSEVPAESDFGYDTKTDVSSVSATTANETTETSQMEGEAEDISENYEDNFSQDTPNLPALNLNSTDDLVLSALTKTEILQKAGENSENEESIAVLNNTSEETTKISLIVTSTPTTFNKSMSLADEWQDDEFKNQATEATWKDESIIEQPVPSDSITVPGLTDSDQQLEECQDPSTEEEEEEEEKGHVSREIAMLAEKKLEKILSRDSLKAKRHMEGIKFTDEWQDDDLSKQLLYEHEEYLETEPQPELLEGSQERVEVEDTVEVIQVEQFQEALPSFVSEGETKEEQPVESDDQQEISFNEKMEQEVELQTGHEIFPPTLEKEQEQTVEDNIQKEISSEEAEKVVNINTPTELPAEVLSFATPAEDISVEETSQQEIYLGNEEVEEVNITQVEKTQEDSPEEEKHDETHQLEKDLSNEEVKEKNVTQVEKTLEETSSDTPEDDWQSATEADRQQLPGENYDRNVTEGHVLSDDDRESDRNKNSDERSPESATVISTDNWTKEDGEDQKNSSSENLDSTAEEDWSAEIVESPATLQDSDEDHDESLGARPKKKFRKLLAIPQGLSVDLDSPLSQEGLSSPSGSEDDILEARHIGGLQKSTSVDETSIALSTDIDLDDDTSLSVPQSPEPIPVLTAKEEYEESRRWRAIDIGGQSYRLDMAVIDPYKKVIAHGGYYEGSNAMILFFACYLPERKRKDYTYVMDNLFLYIVSTLELLVSDDYKIVFFNGGTQKDKTPNLRWLRKCYRMIERRLRKNLKGLMFVHPTFWLRTLVRLTRPFISSKFGKKIKFVYALPELSQLVPTEYMFIPDEIKKLDSRINSKKRRQQPQQLTAAARAHTYSSGSTPPSSHQLKETRLSPVGEDEVLGSEEIDTAAISEC